MGSEVGPNRGKKRENYYVSLARSRVERLDLERASEAEGVGDEIAVTRQLMKKALSAAPRNRKVQRDFKTASAGLDVLSLAMSRQSRVERRSAAEVALAQLGELILAAEE